MPRPAVFFLVLVVTAPVRALAQDYPGGAEDYAGGFPAPPAAVAAPAAKAAATAAPTATPGPTAAKAAPPASPQSPSAPGPVAEKVRALQEAASLLDKAGAARDRGARSFAEQLFSSAELLVGPEALADLASLFRAGAPPRIATPLKQLAPGAPPQPAAVGNSDEEEPAPRPSKGTLSGVVEAGGRPLEGLSVVTLEPASGRWHRRAPRTRVMEQRGRQFAPRLLVVPVGSTVSFPNFDPVYHNVFSTSEARAFDLGIYKSGAAREVTFDREGIIAVGCNLHANMVAHIAVVSAPHYAVTDSAGRFSFHQLAPGNYRLRVWSERSQAPEVRSLVIRPDRNSVTVEVKADAAAGPLPDKFGVSRGKS